jgi:HupE / UreJ protein
MRLLIALLWLCAFASHDSEAHKLSDSYLTLQVEATGDSVRGQWDISLRDLEQAVGVDIDGDANITWGELKARSPEIRSYVFSKLALHADDGSTRAICPIEFTDLLTDQHVDGGYAVLQFTANCTAAPHSLDIDYSLLFDIDPNHRGLLNLDQGGARRAAVFSVDANHLRFARQQASSSSQLRSFLSEGIGHIFHGYDHVLFLLTLLFPTVVLYRQGVWSPQPRITDALLDVAKVVSMFTLAHSITLSLAVLGVVHVPSRLVESAIALTVLLGALNNLSPLITRKRWLVAFLFGLVHGLGFASVLRDLGLQWDTLGIALVGFNIGVEIGQLAIVLTLLPLLYTFRTTLLYRRVFMPLSSILIGLIAAYWFGLRALGSG